MHLIEFLYYLTLYLFIDKYISYGIMIKDIITLKFEE